MKSLILLKTCSVLIIFLLIENSCSTSRKQAVLCPVLPGYHRNKNVDLKPAEHNKESYVFADRAGKTRISEGNNISLFEKFQDKHPVAAKRTDIRTGNIISTDLNKIYGLNKIDYKNNLFASSDNSNISVFKKALSISSCINEFAEIDHNVVNNRKNGDHGNLVNSISKSDIIFVKYPDDIKKFSPATSIISFRKDNQPQKVEPFGFVGLVASLVLIMGIIGFFEFGLVQILCGVLALVFGAIGLSRIKKHPGVFKGKGFAKISLVIGIIYCSLLTLLILAFLIWPPHLNLNF